MWDSIKYVVIFLNVYNLSISSLSLADILQLLSQKSPQSPDTFEIRRFVAIAEIVNNIAQKRQLLEDIHPNLIKALIYVSRSNWIWDRIKCFSVVFKIERPQKLYHTQTNTHIDRQTFSKNNCVLIESSNNFKSCSRHPNACKYIKNPMTKIFTIPVSSFVYRRK